MAITTLLVSIVLGNPAFAVENAVDVVPAGTLLLPYFEVDLDDSAGRTTLFSVSNASAAPQLAHVTFWTDQSRPTLDFTIYLTGYDVWTVNLGPLFRQGTIPLLVDPPRIGGPKEAPAGDDEDAGGFSLDDGPAVVAGEGEACTFPLPAALPPSFLLFIQRVHTGLTAPAGFSEAGRCGAAVFGDNVARGYLTIDVVRNCSPLTPTSPGYFSAILAGADPDPIGEPPGSANTIWGDWFIVDPNNDFAQGDTLIHIEAYRDPTTNDRTNGYTFYGRYNGFSGVDNREPLATVWGVRYAVGGAFDSTDMLCWRDTGAPSSTIYYAALASGACPGQPPASGAGGGADGQPLGQNQLIIFDEEENTIVGEFAPFSPTPIGETPSPCPWETNRVLAGGSRLPVGPFQFGWLYLNLNTDNAFSDFEEPILQSWVGVLFQASGRFSVGLQGVHLDHASDPRNLCIGTRGSVGPCSIE